MKKFDSGFPKLGSLERLENFKLDEFLDYCLKNPKEFEVRVVNDDEEILDTTQKYIGEHDFFGTYFFIDCTAIYSQYKRWFSIFSDIQPFYAIKCNPDRGIVKLITTFPNASFDCASPAELDLAILNGVSPNNTIYANPIKPYEGIQYMRKHRVMASTFDCVEELDKMYEILGDEFTDYVLVLRLYVDDSHSSVPLGAKFGARKEEIPEILEKVKELNGRLVGVSFHVGSGCSDFNAYDKALKDVKETFDLAKEYGYELSFIDLGGGWSGDLPSESHNTLKDAANIVKNALVKYGLENCHVISEPGRYFMHSSVHMCVYIENILDNNNNNHETLYKINEGILGGFKDRLLCNYDYIPLPVDTVKYDHSPVGEKVIIGPSGHRKDVVNPHAILPDMKINDWLLFKNMGDYTMSLTSKPLRRLQKNVYLIRRSSISDEAYTRYVIHSS